MLSVLLWNLKFCCVLSIKGCISRQDRLIPMYIHIYVNLFTCTVWQTFLFGVLCVFEGYWMRRHFWHFINGIYWHFRHVGWYFVGLLSQLKYDFFWKLQQLNKVLRIMPGCLFLVILLWLFRCKYVHFGSNPATPLSSTEINESSCLNGDQGKCEFSGSDPLLPYNMGRKSHHI